MGVKMDTPKMQRLCQPANPGIITACQHDPSRTSNVNHWHAQMGLKEIPDGKLHLGKKQHLQHLQGLLWCLVFAVASGALFRISMTDLQI